MKIRVAILGYGNLGKAIEREIAYGDNLQLVAIFSKRNNVVSASGVPVYPRTEILKFTKSVDLLVLCSGSQSDMLADAPYFSQYFNTINTFDTHACIPYLYKKLNAIAKKKNKIAILSTGWDPGLFSFVKATFSQILKAPCTCFWGKGVSLGHSQAVKQLEGVADAISFTIPISAAKQAIENGKRVSIDLHRRQVFVVSNNNQNNTSIKKSILNMPNYFKGQKVDVRFVSQAKLDKIKNLAHKGEIICINKKSKMHLQVQMLSNPQFTAKIVLSYVRAFKNIRKKYGSGAYTPLHFSPMDLSLLSELDTIKKYC